MQTRTESGTVADGRPIRDEGQQSASTSPSKLVFTARTEDRLCAAEEKQVLSNSDLNQSSPFECTSFDPRLNRHWTVQPSSTSAAFNFPNNPTNCACSSAVKPDTALSASARRRRCILV
jgi:hypothetical protein